MEGRTPARAARWQTCVILCVEKMSVRRVESVMEPSWTVRTEGEARTEGWEWRRAMLERFTEVS